MDVKKDRHFIVQYGKTGTRQKQLYTDDGELQITAKSSNAWVAILREANVGRKEVCRLNMADLKSLVVGNSISLGQMKIYIDSEIESNDMKSNLEVANSANVTKSTPQYSNIPTIKEENNAIKTILSSSGVALPTRKFVLQGSKNLSGLLKPAPSKTMMSAPSKMISNADMKIEASDFINKPKSQSKTIEKENIPNNPVSSSSNSMSLIKISEFKIQSFMLKELKTHQLQAAEFLLTRLRGAPQDPTLESLFQFSSSLSGTWEGYDNSDTEMGGDELDWLEGSKGGGKEKVTETCMSASDQRSEKLYQGAILADEMGLGKSFVSLTVIWTLIKESNYKAVIVCPSSLISNWEKEVARWIGDFRCRPSVVRPGQNNKDLIQAFTYGNSPILIISYDMFRKFAADLNKISRFNILVCDEGHRLKNTCGTKTMDSLTTCKATMRLVLTGTPIQNDLDELHSVVSFVAPGFLGSLSTFKTWIAGPILRLREPNCSTHDKRAGELAMKNMRLLMNQILLRRTQADVLRGSLPPRIDVIIQCRLSDRQKEQYEEEVQELFRNIGVSSSEIRRHTQSSLTHCNNTEPEDTDTGTHTRNIMPDDEAEEDNSSATISYSSVLPSLQRLRQISNGVVEDKTITSSTTATSNSFSTATSNLVQSGKDLIGLSQASKKARVSDDKTNLGGSQKVINNAISGGSSKLQVLVTLLSSIHEHDPTERVVIVSNFTGVLDRVATLATAHHWAYLRLDGSTVIKKRQQLVDTFNEGMDSSYLFLLSSKAGGVGLNLIGASRLIMMDADWNPATDRQAMGRIWRPGQKRSVVIYRLVADKTIECSILQRQTMKIGLSAVFGTETSDKSVQPASSGNKDIAANSTTSTKQSGAAVKVSTSDEPFVTTQWAFDALSDPVETTVEAEDTVVGNQVDEATLLDDKTDMDVNSTELGFTVPECGFASIWTKSSLVQLVLPTSSPAVIGELSMIEKNEKLDVSTGMFFSDPIAQQLVTSWSVE